MKSDVFGEETVVDASTQPLASLSPWWRVAAIVTMAACFAVLILLTVKAYQNAPPIPDKFVDPAGPVVLAADDVIAGQQVFLKHGLMDNGTIWGHGGYLGPDFSAAALHTVGTDTADALAQSQYNQSFAALGPMAQAAVKGEVEQQLKINRYDSATDTLTFTAGQAKTFRGLSSYWAQYF